MPKLRRHFCQEVREDIRKWDDYFRFNAQQYHEVTQFVMGDQWREDEARVFETYKKLPLTFNKLAPLVNHLCGEQRQNTPQLQVNPEDQVPEQTAEVRTALVKDISLNNDAKVVYQTGFEQAAIGGYGAWILGTKYDSEYTLDQVITVVAVKDPTRCYWDLSAPDPCKVEGMYSGNRTRISRKKFGKLWGLNYERQVGSEGYDDTTQGFWDDDQITLINHYKRTYKRGKIYLLSNGQTVTDEELAALERVSIGTQELLMINGEPCSIENDRVTHRYKIKHYQIAGDFVLEESEFPSECLPVIFNDQHSYYDKHGKQICRPIVKDARDAQRLINFLGTQGAYLIKISRNDQFILSKSNVRSPDTAQIWRDPLIVQGGLIYDESPNGNKPEQLRPPEISQSLTLMYERAERDIHTCLGMYDTQLGDKGNEISGAAIDARTKRGSYNNYVTFDSLNRSIAVTGKIIDEMIPKVYDTHRQMMLYMPETGLTKVSINQPADDYGMLINNDMRKGRYNIRLQPGPSFEGQKMEALESLQMMVQNSPENFQLVADLMAENLPLPNNIQIKNRFKTIVPPEVIEAGKTGKPAQQQKGPSPEQLAIQIQMQQLQERAQESRAKLVAKEKELLLKEEELKHRMKQDQAALEIELARVQTERLQAAAALQEQELRFEAETNRTQADIGIAHADNLVKLLTHNPKLEKPKNETR